MSNINFSYINTERNPIVISVPTENIDPASWAKKHHEQICQLLMEHSCILFRGFDMVTPADFEAFVQGIYPKLKDDYGDLPKVEGSKRIYKSTPYPDDMKILFHNESSHLSSWPIKQWFFCMQPAEQGGATPIVDCRKVYEDIPEGIRDLFVSKGLLYTRTFLKRLDVTWERFFNTTSREEVEAICQQAGTKCRWLDDGSLQTLDLSPAIIAHPTSNEMSFFNQIQLHHPYYLDEDIREMLVDTYGEKNLPRNVLFGDGSIISDEILQKVNEAYDKHTIRFDWQKGDVLMLDNMLVAHSRDEFKGERKIAVAMGDMYSLPEPFAVSNI